MVDEKVIEAFNMMWGNFPVPARLIHRDKTVLAINDAAKEKGFKAGVPCFTAGNPETHKSCMAPEMLATNKTVQQVNAEKDIIRFWIPVKDCPDAYVHFPLRLNEILG